MSGVNWFWIFQSFVPILMTYFVNSSAKQRAYLFVNTFKLKDHSVTPPVELV